MNYETCLNNLLITYLKEVAKNKKSFEMMFDISSHAVICKINEETLKISFVSKDKYSENYLIEFSSLQNSQKPVSIQLDLEKISPTLDFIHELIKAKQDSYNEPIFKACQDIYYNKDFSWVLTTYEETTKQDSSWIEFTYQKENDHINFMVDKKELTQANYLGYLKIGGKYKIAGKSSSFAFGMAFKQIPHFPPLAHLKPDTQKEPDIKSFEEQLVGLSNLMLNAQLANTLPNINPKTVKNKI